MIVERLTIKLFLTNFRAILDQAISGLEFAEFKGHKNGNTPERVI